MPPESGLKHKPFSALRNAAAPVVATAKPAISVPDKPTLGRVIVREEFDTTEAAVITRVIGLPQEHLSLFARQWREKLGEKIAKIAIEGRELLVMTNEYERVATLVRNAGASDVVIVRRPIPADLSNVGEAGGTLRAQIRRGLRVAIVQKADQDTGTLTEGVVRDILTSSPEHHRGIKVRLESGEVGRVRRILSR